jgi:hypothetical protein
VRHPIARSIDASPARRNKTVSIESFAFHRLPSRAVTVVESNLIVKISDREFGAKKRTSDIIFLLVGVGVRAIVAARDAMPISAIRRLFSSMRAARAASNAFVSVVMRAFASSFVVE